MIFICSFQVCLSMCGNMINMKRRLQELRIRNITIKLRMAFWILLFRSTVSTLFFCVLLWGTKSTSSSTECHDQNYHHDYNQELTCILYNATKISPQVALPIASRPNLCVFNHFNLECINAVISIFFRILQIWTSWHHRSFCIVCNGKLSSAPVLQIYTCIWFVWICLCVVFEVLYPGGWHGPLFMDGRPIRVNWRWRH